jgi:mannose-1-phosphate guanylyltransferase/mannose-6-phosphate isomerase
MSESIFNVTPVILSGGSGSRLWPLSRSSFPKQFLNFSEPFSLFQNTVTRLNDISSATINLNETLIVTNEEHRFLVLHQLEEFSDISSLLLLEPLAMNTAPALTLAALQSLEINNNSILIVSPSDHVIKDHKAFNELIQKSLPLAESGAIVTLGIKPLYPNTGFGYIEYLEKEKASLELNVECFCEKPNQALAESFIKQGNFAWNSGIFVLKASVWIKAIQHFRLDIFNATKDAFVKSTKEGNFLRPDKELFKKIPSESIDYAVMEKCPHSNFEIKMLLLDAGWSDLGSWESFWEISKKDDQNNVLIGDVVSTKTHNSLIYSQDRLVSASGVDNLVIIETSDAVLIINRSESQHIKLIVNNLMNHKNEITKFHRKVQRPWGWYDTIDNGNGFKVKRIQVNVNASLSLQKHSRRSEHWVVVKGQANIICDNHKIVLNESESTFIPKGKAHRLSNFGSVPLEIIEVQTGSYLGEDDIERIDDEYGRI